MSIRSSALCIFSIFFSQNLLAGICGPTEDFRDVERYSGEYWPSVQFVREHALPVAIGTERATPAENADDSIFQLACSATLVGKTTVLSAGHCNSYGSSGQSFLSRMTFGYQKRPIGDIIPQGGSTLRLGKPYFLDSILEINDDDTVPDYVLVRLEASPKKSFGTSRLAAIDIAQGEQIAVIGHPGAGPKAISAGTYSGLEQDSQSPLGELIMATYDLDTLNGSSGAGVLDASGFVVGVVKGHGCDAAQTKPNRITPNETIYKDSSLFRNLAWVWNISPSLSIDYEVEELAVSADGTLYAYVYAYDVVPPFAKLTAVYKYLGADTGDSTNHLWELQESDGSWGSGDYEVEHIYTANNKPIKLTANGSAYEFDGYYWQEKATNVVDIAVTTGGTIYAIRNTGQLLQNWSAVAGGPGLSYEALLTSGGYLYWTERNTGLDLDLWLYRRNGSASEVVKKASADHYAMTDVSTYRLSKSKRSIFSLESSGLWKRIYSANDNDASLNEVEKIFVQNGKLFRIDATTGEVWSRSNQGAWGQLTRPADQLVSSRSNDMVATIDLLTNHIHRYKKDEVSSNITKLVKNNEIASTMPAGGEHVYTVAINRDATELRIDLDADYADYDIYVRYEAMPDLLNYDAKSTSPDAHETIQVANPQEGIWYVWIRDYYTDERSYDLSVTVDDFDDDPDISDDSVEVYSGYAYPGDYDYHPNDSYYYSNSGSHQLGLTGGLWFGR